MSEHDRHADRLERDLDEMQERSDRLEDEIDDTRQDWERKKHDSGVPGAAGDPERAEEEVPPEADFPSKGD
jgi:predicted  nucleic acid-binding Zn-ribbon protein